MAVQGPRPKAQGSRCATGVQLIHAGCISYTQAWELQRKLHADAVAGGANTLLLCEHPSVYTLGRQSREANLLLTRDEYARLGAEVVETDRGGDVTWHGPGQLVGYPVLRLADFPCGRDVEKYLRALEEVLIRALAACGVHGERSPGKTGVWVKGAKIAALGVKCARWTTMHGFALNVHPDLAWFSRIVPCGLSEPVTSLEKLGVGAGMTGVQARVQAAFGEVFECRMGGAGVEG